MTEFHARHLRHLHAVDHPMFITFRLHGSLPSGRSFPTATDSGKAFVDYDLHSYVTMPNHVHMLVTPHAAVSIFMKSLKRFTSREANRVLGLTGQPFWQHESYDRLVRDRREFDPYRELHRTEPGQSRNVQSAGRISVVERLADCQYACPNI